MKSKLMIIAVVLVFLFVVAASLGLFKTLYLNKPSKSPDEVYVFALNHPKSENRDYYIDEKTFNEYETDEEDTSEVPNNTLVKEEIDGKTAIVVRNFDYEEEGIEPFDIEMKLKKTGNWIDGYEWKIEKITFPDWYYETE